MDSFTSGFELSWTSKPTYWDNEYFTNLLEYDWSVYVGPGNRSQWRPSAKRFASQNYLIYMYTQEAVT